MNQSSETPGYSDKYLNWILFSDAEHLRIMPLHTKTPLLSG